MATYEVPTPEASSRRLRRIGDCTWEIDDPSLAVPARVFADDALLDAMRHDRSLMQLENVTTLPGLAGFVAGMPDMHEGYGFPVGGVAATLWPDGVVSPGGIGFDINCGVRLLTSTLLFEEIAPVLERLVHELSRSIPAGYGRHAHEFSLDADSLAHVLEEGVPWLVRTRGLGTERDLERIESSGKLPGASASAVSNRARQRGHDQLGTLGGGNHFLEVQVVDEVYDEPASRRLGLTRGSVTVLIHTGSRGLGHQVCTDAVRTMGRTMQRYGITVPDRQLACAPLSSPEGRAYLAAMSAAANFAFCNRQAITYRVRSRFEEFFGALGELRLVYDVAHNTAKVERHGGQVVCVHRKGATRSFGPSAEELAQDFRGLGQPVLIPGSMGTASWVLLGTDASSEKSWSSCCHGAGRTMSRGQAKRTVTGAELRRRLAAQGIVVRCPSNSELAEEAPQAYKDVDRVVDVVHRAGLARKVARLRPVGVVKG